MKLTNHLKRKKERSNVPSFCKRPFLLIKENKFMNLALQKQTEHHGEGREDYLRDADLESKEEVFKDKSNFQIFRSCSKKEQELLFGEAMELLTAENYEWIRTQLIESVLEGR